MYMTNFMLKLNHNHASNIIPFHDMYYILTPFILITGGNYLYNTYRDEFHRAFDYLKAEIRGLHNYNRENELVFRDLDNEYGVQFRTTITSSTRLEGIFHNNKITGLGNITENSRNGTVYRKGIFKNNKLHGKGTKILKRSGEEYIRFEGMFKNDKLHGDGKITTKHDTLEGTFKNGCIMTGVYKHESDFDYCKYAGRFDSDEVTYDNLSNLKLNGHGKIDHKTFSMSGNFKNNVMFGYGVYTDKVKGSVTSGNFIDDEVVGTGSIKFDNRTVTSHNFGNVGKFTIKYNTGDMIEVNEITRRYTLTYKNGDVQKGKTLSSTFHKNIDSYVMFKDIISYELKSSFETLTNQQLMCWIKATDRELFRALQLSNLCGVLNGKMLMSFEKPEDFDLPDVNKNLLQRLLDCRPVYSSDEDVVVIS